MPSRRKGNRHQRTRHRRITKFPKLNYGGDASHLFQSANAPSVPVNMPSSVPITSTYPSSSASLASSLPVPSLQPPLANENARKPSRLKRFVSRLSPSKQRRDMWKKKINDSLKKAKSAIADVYHKLKSPPPAVAASANSSQASHAVGGRRRSKSRYRRSSSKRVRRLLH